MKVHAIRFLRLIVSTVGLLAGGVVVVAALIHYGYTGLGDHKELVSRYLGDALDRPVSIQALTTRWHGMTAVMRARGVRLHQQDSRASTMRLGEVELRADLLSLLKGRLDLAELTVLGPTLEVVGERDGRVRIGDYFIGERPSGGSSGKLLKWLFEQGAVSLRDAVLVWRDEREPDQALRLRDINLWIINEGTQHRFIGSATFPTRVCRALRLSGQLRGAPPALQGTFNADLEQLNVAALPLRFREFMPWLEQGRLDVELSSSIVAGEFAGAVADVSLSDFDAPYGSKGQRMRGRSFTSQLSWQRDDESWRISLIQPELELADKQVLQANQVALEKIGDRRIYSAESVDIGEIVDALHTLKIALPGPELIDGLSPEGLFSTATLLMEGPFLKPRDWRFEGKFARLGWRAQPQIPGLSGLVGSAVIGPRTGRLEIDGAAVRLDYSAALREPIELERLAADLRWVQTEDHWLIDVADLSLANPDAALTDGRLYAKVPRSDPAATYMDAVIHVPRLKVASVPKFLPAKMMKSKGVNWVDRAMSGGNLVAGRAQLTGLIKQFPFGDGGGRLEVSARVENGVLDYAPRWPPLTGLTGSMSLHNQRFEARAERGLLMNTRLSGATAQADDMFSRTRVLRVDGAIDGPVNDVAEFLLRGPLTKTPSGLRISGAGEGSGRLQVRLPFTRLKQETTVKGVYVVDGASVTLPPGIVLSDLRGQVNFTDKTVNGNGLQGELMGGPVTLDVETIEPRRPPLFAIDGRGRGRVRELQDVLGRELVAQLSGPADWRGRLVVDRGQARLRIDSNLVGMTSRLPPPLAKVDFQAMATRVDLEFDDGHQRIDFNVGGRLDGLFRYRNDEGGLRFVNGQLKLGPGQEATTTAEPGLSVFVVEETLDVDPWISLFSSMAREGPAVAAGATDAKRASLVAALRKLDLTAQSLSFLARDIGRIQMMALTPDSRTWRATLAGDAGQGTALARFLDAGTEISVDMSTLRWPRLAGKTAASPPPSVADDPSSYIALSIDALDFHFGEMSFGRLRFRGRPENEVWRISEVSMDQPALKIEAEGEWTVTDSGSLTRIRSTARMLELGKALRLLGFTDHIAKGTAEVNAELSWDGSPGQFDYNNLDGSFELNAQKGRFLKVDPGSSGRLLGLFNIEALTRRLTLDFSDIFSKGLAFDRITGDGVFDNGDLKSDGLYLFGPATLIETRGRAGLAVEDYDMEVVVVPQVGGNLSLLGALANPAAGAVIFIMQKVFKKQLAKAVHYRYHVTGPWVDPVVESIQAGAESEVEQSQRPDFESGSES